MTDATESLILEYLKRFRADVDRVGGQQLELISRIGQLEIAVAALKSEVAHTNENVAAISVRIDRLDQRIERIERRLELL